MLWAVYKRIDDSLIIHMASFQLLKPVSYIRSYYMHLLSTYIMPYALGFENKIQKVRKNVCKIRARGVFYRCLQKRGQNKAERRQKR